MKNELLLIAEMIITFGAVLFAYKRFGKLGLFIWIPIATILANIQVLISVQMLGLASTLGNVIYSSTFLATDILSENYSKNEAKKAVGIGFFTLIVTTILMNFILQYNVINDAFSKEMYNHVASIFKAMPRLVLASLTAFFVSQNHDVWAYQFWKRKLPDNKHLWIRNNASTVVSQILDTGIFTLIAFYKVLPVATMWEIFVTTLILKTVISFADTPFFLFAVKMFNKKKVTESEVIPESI
jgi:conserved hypothetical integral membrane protein